MNRTITLTITGMTCDGCVRSLTRALEASPTVKKATVTLEPPQAQITPANTALTEQDCKTLVQKAGFDVA